MLKALPQRDIGAQEVAMMNLQLPLMQMRIRNPQTDKFEPFNFITVSLDNTRQIRNPKYSMSQSSITKNKMLDFYADRKDTFSTHSELQLFSKMNLEEFARNYYLTGSGWLTRYKFIKKNIIRFKPNISPSESNIEQMMSYCKLSLILCKTML